MTNTPSTKVTANPRFSAASAAPIAELIGFRLSAFDEDQSFTPLELKINFLRPVWEAKLLAKARVTSRGKTVGLVECDVTDASGRLMAR